MHTLPDALLLHVLEYAATLDLFKVARTDRALRTSAGIVLEARTVRLRDREPGLEEAVASAEPGATIVLSGRHKLDRDLVVTKTLRILGEPSALINGGGHGTVLRCDAPLVCLARCRIGWTVGMGALPSRSVVEVNRNVRLLGCHLTMDHAPTSPVVSHAVTVAPGATFAATRSTFHSWNGPTLKARFADVTLTECEISGFGAPVAAQLRGGTAEFVGCTFNNEKMDGVALWDAARVAFRSCRICDCARHGIAVRTSRGHLELEHTVFERVEGTEVDYGSNDTPRIRHEMSMVS